MEVTPTPEHSAVPEQEDALALQVGAHVPAPPTTRHTALPPHSDVVAQPAPPAASAEQPARVIIENESAKVPISVCRFIAVFLFWVRVMFEQPRCCRVVMFAALSRREVWHNTFSVPRLTGTRTRIFMRSNAGSKANM